MPLPERYEKEVPEIVSIYNGEGYFQAQGEVWIARCEGEAQLTGSPNAEELTHIKTALQLSKEELDYLTLPEGHETNRFLRLVQQKLPPKVGNHLHKGMTSFDLLDTALALQIMRSLDVLGESHDQYSDALLEMAAKHYRTVQIGRTHGQHAIPQSFGRQVIGWYAEAFRSKQRIEQSKEVIAYGKLSGEIGTNANISPELEDDVLARLGLKPDPAPTQVISRDRHAQVALNMAINAAALGRVSGNIQTLARTEIGEVREPFDKRRQQGSSSMPHKENSEITERVRGLTRWTRVAATAVLDCVDLRDERDISNSATERFAYQDLFGTLLYATRLMTNVIQDARVYPERMTANVNMTRGAVYSARLLNELLKRDERPRSEVYDQVRDMINQALTENKEVADLATQDPKIREIFNPEEIAEMFTPDYYLRNIGTAWKRLGLKNPL